MQVGGGWNLSASFPVDSVGEYTLRLTRQVDVGKLRHISTRRSSEYEVKIPSMEVGFTAGDRAWLDRLLVYLHRCYCCVGPLFRAPCSMKG